MNEQHQRLTIKLVFYGPALSGKTTNLTRLHDLLAPQLKGEMMTLETEGDRTLFFDLLPLGFTAPSGLLIKFKLFTVPGQVAHDSTRKAVLSRSDGVMFVADSQNNQIYNNGASFDNLIANAGMVGLDLATLPLVVQFNKRDLPDILTEEEILARWSTAPWPVYFASALEGAGVLESFGALLGKIYDNLDTEFSFSSSHGLSRAAFIASVRG
ncbi:MAG: GTPase domain-containing protein [Sideroxyarcus sp.]|nr:GTPase domain-containing protein [Sideroxyarcus sp.]